MALVFVRALSLFAASNGRVIFFSAPSASSSDYPRSRDGRIWDDIFLTRDNPFIKSPLLALEAFRHYLFLDSLSGHYRPVQNLSYMLDYFFWNADPAGFHLSNILLHVGAGLLLYRLLTHLFGKEGRPLE